jgi:hypothetical protein
MECPHCFLWIIPTVHGTCPACLESTDPGQRNLKWLPVTIHPTTTLPQYCCICDEPTSRVMTILLSTQYADRHQETEQNDPSLLWHLLSILNPIGFFIGMVFHLLVFVANRAFEGAQKAARTKSVHVPLCKKCTPELRIVDSSNQYLRIRVNRSFHSRLMGMITANSDRSDPFAPPRSV